RETNLPAAQIMSKTMKKLFVSLALPLGELSVHPTERVLFRMSIIHKQHPFFHLSYFGGSKPPPYILISDFI
ncbi:MAG: hypothetical protein IJN21_08850, partial [Clostridia bacterium]|nr:hypothetical protein [Clostridia bacterium]